MNKRNLWAIIQTILIAISAVLPFLLKSINISIDMKGENDYFTIDISKAGLPSWLLLAMVGFLLAGLLCNWFRQENKDVLFNRGHRYKKSCLFWYQFCSCVLGYRKCDLRGVPIPMIVRLTVDETFESYYLGDISEEDSKEIGVNISWINQEQIQTRNELNMIIEDTYRISEEAINKIKGTQKPTVILSREDGYQGRWWVPQFKDKVWEILSDVDLKKIESVNLYMTTNAGNTKDLVENVFMTYGRGKIKYITVFGQESTGQRLFKESGIKIKL